MSKPRNSSIGSSSRARLRAFLEGAASVFDIGIGTRIRYVGPEADARALRGDSSRVGKDLLKSMKAHECALGQ